MKNLIAVFVFATFMSASAFASEVERDEDGATAEDRAAVRAVKLDIFLSEISPQAKWVGAGVGTRFGVNGGAAWRVSEAGSDVRMAAGVTADIISMGGKIVALPQGVFMFATENSPAFMVRTGYSPRTGATIGTDVAAALPLNTAKPISVRAGVTAFEKSVGGSRGVFQVGLVRNF